MVCYTKYSRSGKTKYRRWENIVASMIEKVMKASEHADTVEDAVCETVMDYKQMGQLLAELLEWNGGAFDWDQKAMEFVSGIMVEYIDQSI